MVLSEMLGSSISDTWFLNLSGNFSFELKYLFAFGSLYNVSDNFVFWITWLSWTFALNPFPNKPGRLSALIGNAFFLTNFPLWSIKKLF